MKIWIYIMPNYRNDDYSQCRLIAVNLEEQLVPGTFEYTLHYLVEHYLDLSDFDADYKNDGVGRPAYHPGVLLRIVLFAYSRGIFTSRHKSNITDNESATMKTSHGVIQGYNGVSAVDKKHQMIVVTEVYGAGPEQQTLIPMFNSIQDCYERPGVPLHLSNGEIIVTADTGFANEANMKHCHDNKINAYIPDNQFRSRDPRFTDHLKPASRKRKTMHKPTYLVSAFHDDPVADTCRCPAGKSLRLVNVGRDQHGNTKAFFEGRLTDCRVCEKQQQCMRNGETADDLSGHGRQVSFMKEKKASCTEWMRHRVDTDEGRAIYGHRMHVVEPVFGNIESNKGLNRFTLRTSEKVRSQWQLFSLVHNIEDL
jgi:hypothetical protein